MAVKRSEHCGVEEPHRIHSGRSTWATSTSHYVCEGDPEALERQLEREANPPPGPPSGPKPRVTWEPYDALEAQQ